MYFDYKSKFYLVYVETKETGVSLHNLEIWIALSWIQPVSNQPLDIPQISPENCATRRGHLIYLCFPWIYNPFGEPGNVCNN